VARAGVRVFPLIAFLLCPRREGSGDPSPVRARPLCGLSLNSPSLRKPSFPQRLPDAASPRRLCPPPLQHRLRKCVPRRSICAAPFFATGLRPHLTPTPTASRSGRGVADESLTRLRTASLTHEPRQQVVTSRVATTDPKIDSQRSASEGQLGRLPAGCLAKVLLALARPGSIGAGPGRRRKGALFPAPETTRIGPQMQV
jgi:hypothetical protein